jgi:hypothetical protein
MTGLGLNVTALRFPPLILESTVFSEATSMLLKHVMFSSAMSVTPKVAFSAGSSKQGNARRASIGSIWVVAIHEVVPSSFWNDER